MSELINQQYYKANAQAFYDATIKVDMQTLYSQFLPLIPDAGTILDAGCGAVRHLLWSNPLTQVKSSPVYERAHHYCSFKYGTKEVERNGRVFTNLNERSFAEQINGLPLQIRKQWVTGDLRAGRENEKWLNVLLRKR